MHARIPLLALAAALVAAGPLGAPAAADAVAVAGVGEGTTFSFCNPNVRITLAGTLVEDAWVFEFNMVRHPNCILFLIPAMFEGAYEPAAGGCLAGAPPVGGQLCIDGLAGTTGVTTWRYCGNPGPCGDGEANFWGTIDLVVA